MKVFTSAAAKIVINESDGEMSDEMLVLAAKSGDCSAFVELTKRHSSKLLRRTYRITKNWHDAEDAVQDSFLKAFIHLRDFEERASFSSWVTRIAINSALMILRKKRAFFEIPIVSHTDDDEGRCRWEPRDLAKDPEDRYVQRETGESLRRAILRLPPIFRDVVQLQHQRECSAQEIAQVLGISVPAAKARLARAKAALRTSLLPKKVAAEGDSARAL